MNQDPHVQEPLRGREFAIAAAASALVISLALAACAPGTASNSTGTTPNSGPTATGPAFETGPNTSLEAVPDINDPQLRLLKWYEKEVGVAPRMMDFIGFPNSRENAVSLAESMAGTLQAWHKAGVQPLVIMEPTFNDGKTLMDLDKFHEGGYNEALDTFFATLHELGVTDEEMGTWVPFPESNTPTWKNGVTDPALFVSNTTTVAEACKRYFPNTSISVLLDSQTFLPSPDPNWNDGTMDPTALLQYLNFKPGLIDSFGLQGYSWDNQDSASTYLSAQAAIAGAHQLGIKRVWFTTGTASEIHNPNGEGLINASNARRTQVFSQILDQVIATQNSGYTVELMNVFGQDTLNTGSNDGGTADYNYDATGALGVLRTAVSNENAHGIPVTIFDAPGS
jgi:hypothetical protein